MSGCFIVLKMKLYSIPEAMVQKTVMNTGTSNMQENSPTVESEESSACKSLNARTNRLHKSQQTMMVSNNFKLVSTAKTLNHGITAIRMVWVHTLVSLNKPKYF